MERIGIDASRANSSQRTGTEWYSAHIIQSLAAIDHEDDFFLYTKTALVQDLTNLGANVHEKVLPWPPKRLWTHTRLSAEMLLHAPDVLFVPAHTIPIIHPRRTITTTHDIGFDRFPELYTRSDLFYHRWSMRMTVSSAAHIIVPSAFTKSEICEEYHIPEDRVTVIYHGFDPQRYRVLDRRSDVDDVLHRYHLDKPYFLSIGRLEKKKNTPLLVEAFAELLENTKAPVQLLLAGSQGFHFDDVQKTIRDRHLEHDVLMPGYVPLDDIPALLNGACAFVFPSLYEGFGFPILEAQACGTPVITSNCASMPEISGDSALLIDPKSSSDLAERMENILHDQSLVHRLRTSGFENLQRFTWGECAKKTLAIFRSALS